MLKSVGVKYVLVGHSERRQGNIASETDSVINKKTRKVLSAGLCPILCVGETKEEYELKLNKAVCALQLSKGLAGVTKEEMARVTIAYEPVWAIGTGLTATPEIAQEVHAYIRSWLAQMYDQATADAVRIQYGGSVTPETVDSLMACPGVRAPTRSWCVLSNCSDAVNGRYRRSSCWWCCSPGGQVRTHHSLQVDSDRRYAIVHMFYSRAE
jgi:triosephosphate isomerase (TIM)